MALTWKLLPSGSGQTRSSTTKGIDFFWTDDNSFQGGLTDDRLETLRFTNPQCHFFYLSLSNLSDYAAEGYSARKFWRVSLINIHSVGAPLVPQISTSSVKDYVYRKGSCFVGSLWDFLRWQRLFCKCNMMAFRITMSPGEIHNPWQNPIFDMEDDPVGENHHADWRNVWGRQRGECNRICTKMERASETLSRRSMIDT